MTDTPQHSTQSVIDALKNGIWDISFIKQNGSKRDMQCTLDPLYLPESSGLKTVPFTEGLVRVYDIDNQGWRSFHVKSLTRFSLSLTI